ncbi:MAG TPA: hypothetical protein ENN87_04150, partial [Phycisphaerales bacterium]|nr:hypothetical protein [Phycisphaerales bacterium]
MSLEPFFKPRSVAIVGASRTKGKVGYEVLSAMVRAGYEGDLYAVNPSADEILGVKCYPDLNSIGKTPDLVVVVVAAEKVVDVIRTCAQLGVRAATVISSGFKETGPSGAQREQEIVRIARAAGMRIIGPNCIGVMCPAAKLNASFGGDL